MNSIPVAKATPLRPWRLSRRIAPLVLLGVAAAALGAVMLAVLWPSGEGARIVEAGTLDELTAGEPVRQESGFFLVKLDTGEVIALSETDPHQGFGADPGCPITWRPEMLFEGRTGWLRGTCSGSTFTLTGERVFGPSPRGMDRFPVTVSESGDIRVDTGKRLCAPDYTPVACP